MDVVPDAPAGIAEVDGDESDERDGEGEGALLALGIRGSRSSARTPASTSRMPSSSTSGEPRRRRRRRRPRREGERRDEPPGVGEGDTEARRDDETRATTPVRAEAALDVEPVDPGAGPRRADDTTRSRARGRPTAAPREPTPNILAIVERDANVRSATCPPHRTGRGGYIPTRWSIAYGEGVDMFSNTASENTESRIDSGACSNAGSALVAALARTRPSRVPEWLYARQCSTASIAFTAERTLRACRRPTRRVWREARRERARVRASRREATPPRRTETGTHRPRDGRRPGDIPGDGPVPYPRRGRARPPNAASEGEGPVPAPVPGAVPATVPGVGPPCAPFPAPRRRLRRTPSPPPRAPSRAVRIPGKVPRARLEPDLALFLDDARPVRLHLLRGLVRLIRRRRRRRGCLAGERARGGSLGIRGKGSRR